MTADGSLDGALVCGRCQTANVVEAERCSKCQSWLVGNQKRRTLGLTARHQPADVVQSADQLFDGLVSDHGGRDEMSTLELAIAQKVRSVDILLSCSLKVFVEEGFRTRLGRTAYDAYLKGIDRFDRLASRLSLTRRPKDVGPTWESLNAKHTARRAAEAAALARTREDASGRATRDGHKQRDVPDEPPL